MNNPYRLDYPSFRYVKVRDVRSPYKEGADNAGIDFYVPKDLTFEQLKEANKNTPTSFRQGTEDLDSIVGFLESVAVQVDTETGFIERFFIRQGCRLIIPSGIRGLIDPVGSMFQANNKSGISTKKGLIFGAEVVDSSYTGEIHIHVINTSNRIVDIKRDEKLMQFVHIPVFNPTIEEMSIEEFDLITDKWSSRGSNWQGSTNNK